MPHHSQYNVFQMLPLSQHVGCCLDSIDSIRFPFSVLLCGRFHRRLHIKRSLASVLPAIIHGLLIRRRRSTCAAPASHLLFLLSLPRRGCAGTGAPAYYHDEYKVLPLLAFAIPRTMALIECRRPDR